MPNHLKKCSCTACRRGLHTKSGSVIAKAAVRANRRAVKAALVKGEEPPKVSSLPYTG